MRIILTSVPVYSHLVPLIIPLAKELTRAGHTVAVATGECMADEVAKHGMAMISLPHAVDIQSLVGNPEQARKLGITIPAQPNADAEAMTELVVSQFFLGTPARLFGEDLVAAAESWQPDLIIRECTEFGGYLAAEKLGVPHAVLDVSPISFNDWDFTVKHFMRLRAEFELSGQLPTPEVLRIGVVPPSWYSRSTTANFRCYLPTTEPDRTPLDPAIANLPADNPLVLATLGSSAPNRPELCQGIFSTIIETLGNLPCTGVVALGKNADPSQWPGPIPGNVHLTSFVQQKKLLPACDLFITHAGFSGVRESLLAGVPMVAIPLFADQPVNAQRVTELGIGLSITPDQLSISSLDTACKQVLNDPSYRLAARGLQRQFFGLPGFDQLAVDVVDLFN